MRTIRQILAVTWLNIRNVPQRLGASLVAVIGVAAVVLVFAAVLSMAKGFERTMISAGSEDTAIIMRSGATSEMNSGLSHEQTLIVANAPGVLKDGDTPVASAELYVVVDIKKKSTNEDANVPLRGIQQAAFEVRDNVEIIEGRMFETGRNEFVVGRAAQQEFVGLDVGSKVRFGQTEWNVVGTFSAGGSVSESELWTDVRVLQDAYRRGNSYQSIRVKLTDAAALEQLEQYLEDDPRIDPDVMSERTYYSTQAEGLSRFIRMIGYPLTILMAIGAVFGALNSMYSSVSARGKEIATLRALGFGPFSVMAST
ncbi:MAG: ABC transporter permease, partial [Woeseiaceae bacterium]